MSDQENIVQFPGTEQPETQESVAKKPEGKDPNPWARLTLSSDAEGGVQVDMKLFPDVEVDEETGMPAPDTVFPTSHQVMFRLMNRLELMFNGAKQENIDDGIKSHIGGVLYNEYCNRVGWVNYAGDPLPTWDEFSMDENKRPQVEAWTGLAEFVIQNFAAA